MWHVGRVNILLFIKSKKGGGLFEVILSFGVFGLTMMGFTAAMGLYKKQVDQTKIDQKSIEIRRLLNLHLKNEMAWANTIKAPSNSHMECLFKPGVNCDPNQEEVSFDLYDSANQRIVSSSDSSSGLNMDLKPCASFDSDPVSCPFKVKLTWKPQCRSNCESPLILIGVQMESNLGASGSRFSALQQGTQKMSIYAYNNPYTRVVKTEHRDMVRCILFEPGALKCFENYWSGSASPEVYGLEKNSPASFRNSVQIYEPNLLVSQPAIDVGSGLLVKDFTLGAGVPDVGANRQHVCALLNNNRLKCWGGNNLGQLGLGHKNPIGNEVDSMGNNLPFVDLGSDHQGRPLLVKKVTAGSGFTCALFFNEKVKCWGKNDQGILGLTNPDGTVALDHRGDDPNEMGDNLPYLNFGRVNNDPQEPEYKVKDITANWSNICAVLDNGRLKCWGDNDRGQLGLGNAGYIPNFTSPFTSSYNFDHTSNYAFRPKLDENGDPIEGQNVLVNVPPPPPVNPALTFYGDTNNADLSQSSVGQSGVHETLANLPFIDLGKNLSTDTEMKVLDAAIGAQYVCAVLEIGDVVCWGNNYFSINYFLFGIDRMRGFLGRPAPDQNYLAIGDQPGEMGQALLDNKVNLGVGKKAKRLFIGGRVNCALLTNDQIKCWGSPGAFVPSILVQGLGTIGARNIGESPSQMGENLPFVDVGTSETVRQISIGLIDSCAVLSSGRMKCWGMGWIPSYDPGPNYGLFSQIGDSLNEMGDNLRYVRVGQRGP